MQHPDDATRPIAIERERPLATQILKAGRNCRDVTLTRRAALLVDGSQYFPRLARCLRMARQSIVIVGWDFDGHIHLQRDPAGNGYDTLGPLLRALVEANPALEVRILVWSVALAHAPGSSKDLIFGADWQRHSRISVRLDTDHPLYAAHHQKIVTIDDSIAFVGGIDLTVQRWDSPGHLPHDPARQDGDAHYHRPVHDMQMLVDSRAAADVAGVARLRWRRATGEELPVSSAQTDLWPSDVVPDFENTPMGIARTLPGWNGHTPVSEVAALIADALSAARQSIYIETQYLAAPMVADILAKALARADGPEIVILTTRTLNGLLEQIAMGLNRDRLIRRLRKADRFGRLRAFFPVSDGSREDAEILIHAKLIVIDDRFLRVGSSNLNNRSLGLDTECDIGIEANNAASRRAIERLRNQLVGEHLAVDASRVAEAIAAEGSLVRAIDRLNGAGRLRPFAAMSDRGPSRRIPLTTLLDPKRPFNLASWLSRKR
ncbi:MAG TPA: phospholipase D-like domain-containing protein [Aurantimonas sp.]|nr:phospholipase D-like domain-containing protein [Aurantimonas marianensis]